MSNKNSFYSNKGCKGFFSPTNVHKYKGNVSKIIYRSSYELKFMFWCDTNKNVLEWSSEETVVIYRSPVDNKYHRYFVDFKIKIKNKQGIIETILIEIKPAYKLQEPKPKKRKTRAFLNEVKDWLINNSKWKAADEYCKDRNWKFQILTEKELNIKS